MKRVIVTTTINAPTEAVRRFDVMKDWTLLVVGDKKTPAPYALERGVFLSCEAQEQIDKELSDCIGWSCIQRRNMGLLWAMKQGADIIATVDDDNVPLDGWGQDLLVGRPVEVDLYRTTEPVFDPIGATNYPHLWHRGFPLECVPRRSYGNVERVKVTPDVQADFWNGDPDIDAVCRMIHAPNCTFDPARFPLASDVIAPFNSQNTFLARKVMKDYFMFPFVGRMDDIWAAYYAGAVGHRVVFNAASVRQDRNVHDLLRDMRGEYVGYENNLLLIEDVKRDPSAIYKYLPGRAVRAFELYRRHFGA